MRIDVDEECLQVGEHCDEVVQVALPVLVNCLLGSWPATSDSCTNHGIKTSMLKRLVNGSKPEDVTACNELGLNKAGKKSVARPHCLL